MKRDIYTCISCKLNDSLVECGGIYYCPNPFCMASGSANWKVQNLNVRETIVGIELVNTVGWLEKGLEVIDKMGYVLGNKIMRLAKTKEIIRELKKEKIKNENPIRKFRNKSRNGNIG